VAQDIGKWLRDLCDSSCCWKRDKLWHKEGPEEREKGPEETHGMKPKAQRSKMKSKLNPT